MSYTLLHFPGNSRILSWIAQELRRQIPNFSPHGQDRRVLALSYQSLQTCLRVRWKVADPYQLRKRMMEAAENRPEEVRAFLKVWTSWWLKKWRERVTLFQKIPRISKRRFRSLLRAKRIYRGMKKRQELKRMVIQKLVNQGEVCMPQLIAETLIIRQIAHKLNKLNGKNVINPTDILQGVRTEVDMLADRKTPLIYLKMHVYVDN